MKEIKPVNPKGNQLWIYTRRTDVEAEGPVLWPRDGKSLLIEKDPDAGQDWGQEEKGMTEDEMVGWHHQLSGHEFEHTPGDDEGQGSLACCSSWGRKESDRTEWLNKEQQQQCVYKLLGFPGGTRGKENACQCRRHKRCGFDPWVGTIPWRRAWQPTPVFLPGESHRQRSLMDYSP